MQHFLSGSEANHENLLQDSRFRDVDVTLTNQPNNSTEKSPSSEGEKSSVSQEILRISWNPKVLHHNHERPQHLFLSSARSIKSILPHRTSLLALYQRSSPSPRQYEMFRSIVSFNGEEMVALRQNPKLEGHPLSALHNSLFNIFATNLHTWRSFVHWQPEDAPCCGERDPRTST